MPYVEAQKLFDADYPKGRRYYWKSLYLRDLSDDVIRLACDAGVERPTPISTVEVWALGGAMGRVRPEATAFYHRQAPFLLTIEANAEDPATDEANIAWVRRRYDEGTWTVQAELEPYRSLRPCAACHGRRLKAQSLLQVARRYPQFPIVLETYRECLQDVFDLGALRGILRGFGRKVGKTTPRMFEGRIRELVAGHATLTIIADALLAARAALARELRGLEKRVRETARTDERTRLLMSTPGVGAIVALTYVAAIDDPGRFRSSKQVGAHFGLTPRKYQSGETDVTGRISKIGDGAVRTALYEAANIILTRPVKGSALKRWGLAVAKRAGARKAKVALARKLACVLHRMLVDGTPFAAEPTRQPRRPESRQTTD